MYILKEKTLTCTQGKLFKKQGKNFKIIRVPKTWALQQQANSWNVPFLQLLTKNILLGLRASKKNITLGKQKLIKNGKVKNFNWSYSIFFPRFWDANVSFNVSSFLRGGLGVLSLLLRNHFLQVSSFRRCLSSITRAVWEQISARQGGNRELQPSFCVNAVNGLWAQMHLHISFPSLYSFGIWIQNWSIFYSLQSTVKYYK